MTRFIDALSVLGFAVVGLAMLAALFCSAVILWVEVQDLTFSKLKPTKKTFKDILLFALISSVGTFLMWAVIHFANMMGWRK